MVEPLEPREASAARYPEIGLSVVLPAFNDAENLRHNLPLMVAALRSRVGHFEILVIDDCSSDATAQVAAEMVQRFPEVTSVRNQQNLRQGGSLRVGFPRVNLDWVTHNAADYPFRYESLDTLVPHMAETDVVVVGRRTYPGVGRLRRGVSWLNRTLIRGLFGVPVRDFNFVQLYRREVLGSIPTRSDATSFITAETIIRAHAMGYRVREVECDYFRREAGVPSSAKWSNIQRALLDMSWLRWELWRHPRGDRGTKEGTR